MCRLGYVYHKEMVTLAAVTVVYPCIDRDGFAVHTHTNTNTAKSPETTAIPGQGTYRPRKKPFIQFPAAGKLSVPLRGFLTLIMERAWKLRLGYTIDTNIELGELAGLHRSTVDEYLAVLKRKQFIQTSMVNGRRRIYPVDDQGNPTMPVELSAGVRRPKTAPAPPLESCRCWRPLWRHRAWG